MTFSASTSRIAFVALYAATVVMMAIIFISASMTVMLPGYDAPKALYVLGLPIVAFMVWRLNVMHQSLHGDPLAREERS